MLKQTTRMVAVIFYKNKPNLNREQNIFFAFLHFSAPININYEIADHCVTLKKSGTLSQVESLRSMNRNDQLSVTTENALRQLKRSSSEEIFDRVKKLISFSLIYLVNFLSMMVENRSNRYSRFITVF